MCRSPMNHNHLKKMPECSKVCCRRSRCAALTESLCACVNRWDQCFIRLLDGMLQVIGFAGASDGDFALRIPVRIRAISLTEPGGSERSVLPCNVQRVLGATFFSACSTAGFGFSENVGENALGVCCHLCQLVLAASCIERRVPDSVKGAAHASRDIR